MKIRMRTTAAGPNGTVQAGALVEVDKKTAKALVDGGFATYEAAVKAPAKKAVRPRRETATAPPPETAAAPAPVPHGGPSED